MGLLFVVLLALWLGGCRTATPPAPVARTMTIAAGIPIKLILFDELTSGGSEKGSEVRFALAEPVEGLPLLSPASAVVTDSRTEGTLGALMNRPARLKVEFKGIKGPSGEDIPLSAEPKEVKEYEFNRSNTGRPNAPDTSPEDEPAQMAIKELIEQGQSGGLDSDQVGQLAKKLGMSETAKLADTGKLSEVQNLCRTIRNGGTVAGLASGGTLAAAMELVNLAGDVGHRLGRSLGGRNIRAYPGTIVTVYVLRDTPVTLP